MDWSNEPYVKVYTRETDDDVILPWEARAIWDRLLTRFDRSGFFETRRGTIGVSAATRIPLAVVEQHLPELLADGRLVEVEGGYLAPNFMEAQGASKSDRLRQRESREKRRATKLSQPVTNRDSGAPKRGVDNGGVTDRDGVVTNRDGSVTNVTLTSADPDPKQSVADPDANEEAPPAPCPAPYRASQVHNPRTKLNFDAWQYAALEHARLIGEGLTGSMPWPHMPAGAPMHDLVDRVKELLEQGGIAQAADILRRRVDVAVAESKREGHLRWFTPSQVWDAKRFYRAIEVSPADAAKPRSPPRGTPAPNQPTEPPRRIKTFG